MTEPLEIKDIPGLVKRHVRDVVIDWEDTPPPDIADERADDIMLALAADSKNQRHGHGARDRAAGEARLMGCSSFSPSQPLWCS